MEGRPDHQEDADVPPQYRETAALRGVAGAAFLLALAGCGASASPTATPRATAGPVAPTATPGSAATPTTRPAVDPASVHADELGVVPVLMYHQLLAHPTGDYDQTPAQFRTELEQLYAHGYRTVTAAALATGTIDLPAGAHPMVLTFDDSTVSQYGELPDGTVDPQTAVGILLAVGKAHGQARPVASFYVNSSPFAGRDTYLARLAALGMELGDHTATHANLRKLDAAGVQRELVKGLDVITGAVPGATVTTMALPYGATPHDRALAHTGSAGGTSYTFRAVLLVGSNPAASPYARGFDPLELPRIRSGRRTGDQSFTSTEWLPKLFSGAIRAFTSDGDPTRISFPTKRAARLDPRFAAMARPY